MGCQPAEARQWLWQHCPAAPDGKQIRGRVVYVQPKAERWREQSATVHFLCSDWLEPYLHKAVYVSPAESWSGTLTVLSYTSEAGLWGRLTAHRLTGDWYTASYV